MQLFRKNIDEKIQISENENMKKRTKTNNAGITSLTKGTRVRPIANHGMMAKPCVASSGSSSRTKEASPGKYLTFIVQNYYDAWIYVYVTPDYMGTSHQPSLFPLSYSSQMFELWKRVVLDNAIPWEDSVKTDTLRIVEYEAKINDCTFAMFADNADAKEFIKMSAVSKLSSYEAQILGLSNMKAKQVIMNNPNFDKDDGKLMQKLCDETSQFTLNGYFKD